MPGTDKILNRERSRRLYFYSLLFFVLLIPFQFKELPLTLGLMLYSLVWLVTLRFGQKMRLIGKNRMASLFFLYALWMVLGAIYSPDRDDAVKYLVLKIPFAVWPILMASVSVFKEKDKKHLLQVFIYAVVAAILFSFGRSIYQYLSTGNDAYLYFTKLISYQMVPPHYFGMYVNFAYGSVLLAFFQGRFITGRKWLSVLLLVLFFIAVVFISVRIQYVVFAVLNIAILFGFKNRVALRTKLIWTVGVLAGLLLLVYTLPGSRARLVDTVNEIISFDEMVNNKQTNPRKFLWLEGWKVVKQNFWFGTGTGAEDEALQKEVRDVKALFWDGNSNYYLYEKGYNYHNTYLQHWAAHGLIGFAILLAIMILPFFRRGSSGESKVFLLVCGISFLTESMLQRQAGVLFFTFFYSLFFIMRTGGNIGEKKDQTGEHRDAPVAQ